MLSLQVGSPGSGKSYEATVYQILPALQSGRKVITNLPINIHILRAISPEYVDLLEIRNERRGFINRVISYYEKEKLLYDENNIRHADCDAALNKLKRFSGSSKQLIFSNYVDYLDDWENPDISGQRALFVIDEAHECLSLKIVPEDVEFWYAKHRHAGHDVVLLTQNEMKIFKNIRDLAEISVRTKRLLLFGFKSHYYRFVYYGSNAKGTYFEKVRRKYDPQLCGLYESFTAGGSAFNPNVKPIWLSPKVFLFVGAIVLFIGNFLFSDASILPGVRNEPKKVEVKSAQVARAAPVVQAALPVVSSISAVSLVETVKKHPLDGKMVKIVGQLSDIYWLRIDGRLAKSDEIESLGYEVFPVNDCRFEAFFKKTLEHIRFGCGGMHVIEPS
jgi:zona occludens toxin